MFKRPSSFKDIILGFKNVATTHDILYNNSIKLDKALILSKLSRYEFEKRKYNVNNDAEFESQLRNRGTDFEKLVHRHDLHKRFEQSVIRTFEKMGIKVEVVNRYSYTEEKVQWADVVFPVGGDGTFLLSASKVMDNKKPVVGFNSDPNRSEGHLCLPKKYSQDIRKAIEKLQEGKFDWLLRNRIRISLISQTEDICPKSLHDMNINLPILRKVNPQHRVLPVLALNEVFIGEVTSSRVSHLQMRINGSSEQTNLKCSGVCICTGTGSTSWHLSMNRIPAQSVAELLNLVEVNTDKPIAQLAEIMADLYNKSLVFSADDSRMCYTIRDLISAGVWPSPKGIKPRDFVSKLEIKSNCYEASLVVDGGVSFDFNDGTIAVLETNPQDALRTVLLKD